MIKKIHYIILMVILSLAFNIYSVEGAKTTQTEKNRLQKKSSVSKKTVHKKTLKASSKSIKAKSKSGHKVALKKSKSKRIAKAKKEPAETYIVRRGDTLKAISKKYKVDTDELISVNEISEDGITIGQKLYLNQAVKDREIAFAAKEKQLNEELKTASKAPDLDVSERLIIIAQMMLDIPYKFGGSSFRGLDCSAYVQKVFSLGNIFLPRAAREQFKVGLPVDKSELNIGDLVFFRTYAKFPSHVGIYLGDNLFIHASSKSKKVTIDSLQTPYYFRRFIGAKRFVQNEQVEDSKEETSNKNI